MTPIQQIQVARGALAALERFRGKAEGRAGTEREDGWEQTRDLPWQRARGAVAMLERCAGKIRLLSQ